MSETLHEVVPATPFKLKKITVRDILPITKYLTEVNLMEVILEFLNGKESIEITTTWADIREERGLSAAELNELKDIHGGDIELALADIGMVPELTDGAADRLINVVVDIISEEKSFRKTITFLAGLFEVEEDEILDLGLSELKDLIKGLMTNQSFLSAL